MTEYIG